MRIVLFEGLDDQELLEGIVRDLQAWRTLFHNPHKWKAARPTEEVWPHGAHKRRGAASQDGCF